MCYHLFGEIFATATLLDGLTAIELTGRHASQYEHFLGETLRFVHSLHTMGEADTAKIKTDTTPKLDDQAVHCLFVGYSLTDPTECYWMYDPKPYMVHISCDVVWLHQMFYQKANSV